MVLNVDLMVITLPVMKKMLIFFFFSTAAELAKYLALKTLPKTINTLEWWRQRTTNKFLYLQQLVVWYLSITVTSASSERRFSSAGMIVNDKKYQLSSKHLEALNMLHCNHEVLNLTTLRNKLWFFKINCSRVYALYVKSVYLIKQANLKPA